MNYLFSYTALLFSIFIGFCVPASSQVIQCGEPYTIQEGDTLSNIAIRAYGSPAAQELVFSANRNVLRNIDVIFSGTELFVPCIGRGGSNSEFVVDEQPNEAFLPLQTRVDVAMLTGSDYAPFTDQRYEEGGMITAIAKRAISVGYPDAKVSLSWVNDWGAHLRTLLLERRAFDVGFPWYRPNCDAPSTLDANAKLRCDNFYFSRPVYESILPFFSDRDKGYEINSVADMNGLRICRPTGFLTFDLTDKGLLAIDHFDGGTSDIVLLQPNTPEDCFEMVLSGEADVASVNSLTAQSTLNRMGAADRFVTHDRVASIVAHHIVVPKNRAEGAALIRRIDQGLDAMDLSGELNDLKSKYIQIFYAEN